MLVKSQLACLRPVGFLTCCVYLKYLFPSLFVGHHVNYWVASNFVNPKFLFYFIFKFSAHALDYYELHQPRSYNVLISQNDET